VSASLESEGNAPYLPRRNRRTTSKRLELDVSDFVAFHLDLQRVDQTNYNIAHPQHRTAYMPGTSQHRRTLERPQRPSRRQRGTCQASL